MNLKQVEHAGYVTSMNDLPAMSSQEIAEITGKQHKNVLRDIQKMVKEIGSDLSQCQIVNTMSPDSYGRLQPMTILDKELTFTLLSSYSAKLCRLIVKRWFELEGAGFARTSVQDSVVHLVEREKESRSKAFKAINRGRILSPEQKERRRLSRMANAEAQKQRKAGREWI